MPEHDDMVKSLARMAVSRLDPWSGYWCRNGFTIQFKGVDVGGFGNGYGINNTYRGRRQDLAFQKKCMNNALNICRKLHQKFPFDPSIHSYIWSWWSSHGLHYMDDVDVDI